MSAIQKELCKACDIDPEKFSDRASLHAAIVKGVNKLDEKGWEALSIPAQDWNNAAADEMKEAKKKNIAPQIAEFSDYEPPRSSREEEPARSRRRSSDDEDKPAASSKGETMAVEKLQEGDRVKLVTKRGKAIEGTVVENSKRKEFIVIKSTDGEDEVDYAKVDSVEVFHGTAGQSENAGPEVGDEVKFTTKRGKTVAGVITELTKDTIVIDEKDDYDIDRIDGDITITKKQAARGSTRGSSKDDDKGGRSRSNKEDGAEEEEKKRSSNPRGVSVGGRIRELLSDDPSMTEEAVGKVLKKEDIEFRDQSLKMIYRDCANFLALLTKAGRLKK